MLQLRAMRDILDDDDKDDDCSTPASASTPDGNTGLILPISSDVNLKDLYPQPAQIFHLWQTFLDRVNPITKVIHVPTLQPKLVEAATNREKVSRSHGKITVLLSCY
jgi:hypothetical protein